MVRFDNSSGAEKGRCLNSRPRAISPPQLFSRELVDREKVFPPHPHVSGESGPEYSTAYGRADGGGGAIAGVPPAPAEVGAVAAVG